MNSSYLSLGSNIGNKAEMLEKGIQGLKTFSIIQKTSRIYKTEPYGCKNQEHFYNMMIFIQTKLSPYQLIAKCLSLEKYMGRKRIKKWEARLIDIDIITFNTISLQTPKLNLPHPDFKNRRFVLVPFAEIAPNFILEDQTITKHLESCPSNLSVIPVT